MMKRVEEGWFCYELEVEVEEIRSWKWRLEEVNLVEEELEDDDG